MLPASSPSLSDPGRSTLSVRGCDAAFSVAAAVLVVCLGVAVATVSDTHMVSNTSGIFIGLAATVMTALYQVGWQGWLRTALGGRPSIYALLRCGHLSRLIERERERERERGTDGGRACVCVRESP